MTMLVGQEKLRISEPLAGLDGEREKRSDQLIESEIAERVLARFGRIAVTTEERRRACSVKMAPSAGEERRDRGGRRASGLLRVPSCRPLVLLGQTRAHVGARASWPSTRSTERPEGQI
jgi:hypothetical protein